MSTTSLFSECMACEKVSKEEFKQLEPELRMELVELQQRLRAENFPVMMVFAGVDGAGKHEMVNGLHDWLDPRGVFTHAYVSPDSVERQRPPEWRYWRDLPSNGQIGLYLSAWYSKPLVDRVHRITTQEEFENRLKVINEFERTLNDNGALLVKIWMHLDRKHQRKRLEHLASHPDTEWQIKPGAWENWGLYDRFMRFSGEIVESSRQAGTPWLLVDGRYETSRQLAVFTALRDALKERIGTSRKTKALSQKTWDKQRKPSRGSLKGMDLSLSLEREDYKERLKQAQRKLYQLQHLAKEAGMSTVLVFEGQDAAGKGGAIRRLLKGLDAQEYQVIPIAAPTQEELAHHYLWRFWRHLPKQGRVTIFDRSWYGRVLVERVEGFAEEAAWQRAYEEINEFEQRLLENRSVVCKFWIQIDKEEQLARFEARQETPYKKWKITEEDWRNRDKWEAYDVAVDDMVSLTDKKDAPWILVEGNSKYWARVKVIETVCDRMEKGLAALKGHST